MKLSTFSELGLAARGRISRNRSPRWLLAAAFALSCASIVFVVRAYNAPSPEARASTVSALPKVPARPTSPDGAQTKTRELVKTVRFNLFDLGIYPREVHIQEGLLAITIEDYSGGSPGLVVEREAGKALEPAGVVSRQGASSRGKSEIRLGPGRYQVYMADRPANRALLVVEP